eukprot:m.13658 g.13658  ORF g.13658 m.13658 type:complete len:858 (-) comp6236_c0_seq1:61-2634(-)
METLNLPASFPVLVVPSRLILPGGVLELRCGSDDPHVKLVEQLFWSQSADNPHIVGAFVIICLFTILFSSGKIQATHASSIECDKIGLAPFLPDSEDKVCEIGTAARVLKVAKSRRGGVSSFLLVLEGLCRIRLTPPGPDEEASKWGISQLDMLPSSPVLSTQLAIDLRAAADRLITALESRLLKIAGLRSLLVRTPVALLSDVLASAVGFEFNEKLIVLTTIDPEARARIVLKLLDRHTALLGTAVTLSTQLTGIALSKRMNGKSSGKGGASGQEDERMGGPGSQNDAADDVEPGTYDALKRQFDNAKLSPEAHRVAARELRKLKNMEQSQSHGPEHQRSVTYLEWLLDLPWTTLTQTPKLPDISQARAALDADHYGLDKVKQRIVEFLAVRWHHANARGSILCFVGPPGVGKTSLGRSIASVLGRDFHRVSLGGVRDESDIRGFNRTYVGSQPGRIIQALRHVKSADPVFLLDEIDKLSVGSSVHGDPSAAMLEVLDPAQNNAFVDRYMGVPFDLSKVLFLATANSIDTIPPALLDRMEVIEIPGYTIEEKIHIAQRHVLSRLLPEHGLTDRDLEISEETLAALVKGYTREPGVRTLERKIAALCRAVVVRILSRQREASSGTDLRLPPGSRRVAIDVAELERMLGPPTADTHEHPDTRVIYPGIAVGLSAGAGGGKLMFIEATRMSGSGKVKLTGSLGDVLKESAHIALGWVRSHAAELGLLTHAQLKLLEKSDIHVHFPEGAVGKDGPSGGAALVTALVSLLSGRTVRTDTAVTGEVTLSGAILPVGGIKAKVLAAYYSGVNRVVLPAINHQRDLVDIPATIRASMEFISAATVEDVLAHTLPRPAPAALAKL